MHKHQLTTVDQLVDEMIWSGSSPHMLIHPEYPPLLSLALIEACKAAKGQAFLRDALFKEASALIVRSHFLGARFEQAYEAVCRIIGRYVVQQANLQITADGRTIGEFDLLVGPSGASVHQELAVKFYLGLPMGDSGHIWFGPGQRDRLDLKIQSLLQRQLLLSRQPPAMATLDRLGLQVRSAELVMKGYLFYPFHADNVPVAPAAVITPVMRQVAGMLTPQHLRGYWLPRARIDLLRDGGEHWMVMPKPTWLRPAWAPCGSTLSFEACCKAVDQHFVAEEVEQETAGHLRKGEKARPVMLCRLRPSPQGLREDSRFFITPDDWAAGALDHLHRKT